MTDQTRKFATIRSINHLQLPEHLIQALDDAQLAEAVLDAVDLLQTLNEQWN